MIDHTRLIQASHSVKIPLSLMSFLLNLNTEYHVNDVCFLQIDPMSLTIIHIWVQCYICLNKVILVHACNVQIDIHVYI